MPGALSALSALSGIGAIAGGASAYNPTTDSSVILHLRRTGPFYANIDGSGGTPLDRAACGKWGDSSGLNNHFLAAANNGTRPTIRPSGLRGVDFDGIAQLLSGLATQVLTGGFWVFIYGNYTVNASTNLGFMGRWAGGVNQWAILGRGISDGTKQDAILRNAAGNANYTVSTPAGNDGINHSFGCFYEPSQSLLRTSVDSTEATVAAPDITAGVAAVTLGSYFSGGSYLAFNSVEVIMGTGEKNAAERAAIRAFLANGGYNGYNAYLFYDIMLDTNGVRLASHLPQKGGAWTEHSGVWEINGNALRQTDNTDNRTCSNDVGATSYKINTSLTSDDWSLRFPAIIFRQHGASDYLLAHIQGTTLIVFTCINGSYTNIAQKTGITTTNNVAAVIQAIITPTTIEISVDGSTPLSVFNNSFGSDTRVGFRFGASSGNPSSNTYFNYLIVSPVSTTTLFEDTFAGNEHLNVHVPNTGVSWTFEAGVSYDTIGGAVQCLDPGTNGLGIAFANAATAFPQCITIEFDYTNDGNDVTGVLFNYVDDNNYYYVNLLGSVGIVKVTGGAPSTLVDAGGSGFHVKVVVTSTTVSLYADGVLYGTATRATPSDTKLGLLSNVADTSVIQNFKVTKVG